MSKAPIDIRSLARSHCESAIRTLNGLMCQTGVPPAVRMQCAVHLLDRGYGKPEQTSITHSVKHGAADYTRAELVAIIDGKGEEPKPH